MIVCFCKYLFFFFFKETALMNTRCVVNGHFMVFVRMMLTLDTCLFPVRNPVDFVAMVEMVQSK